MPRYDWRPILETWSREILASDEEVREEVPPEVVTSGWLGSSGATEEQIVAAEERLGVRLPPSYREFLAVTNGWWQFNGYDTPYRFWSTEEVEWFAVRNQWWIDAWIDGYTYTGRPPEPVPDEEYLVYGPGQTGAVRIEYFQTALEISSECGHDSIYLLNPEIVTLDGEWEVWCFDHEEIWRYRSFWEMMHEEHKKYHEVRKLLEQH